MPKRKRTGSRPETAQPQTIPSPPAVLVNKIDPSPRPTSARPKRAASFKKRYSEVPEEHDSGAEESPLTDLDDKATAQRTKGKRKGRRKSKNDEPVVYDIPPVGRKVTNFKGRLGYACLNTILRTLKPEPVFCSRTCRKDTIHKNGIEFAKELGLRNARDLKKLIEWNEENNIRFLRVSSEMFPFASHGELGYDLEFAQEELKAAGDLAKKLGHRLTTHPGQFTQLASPKEAVIEASIRELDYHCQMLRYMGLGPDSVIILHMGGVYNDKPNTLERFKNTFRNRLTDEMRQRLVLENDEMCYSVDDLLPVCEELDVPIVLDYHHNWINPSSIPLSTLIPRINQTWLKKGIKPKQHLSSPKAQFADGSGSVMDRRAHADRCYELPADLGITFKRDGSNEYEQVDLMIEAKDKEQAVLHLYRIYDLQPVKHENLRPEKPQLVSGKLTQVSESDNDEAVEADVSVGVHEELENGKRRTRARGFGKKETQTELKAEQDTTVDAQDETKVPKKRRTAKALGATDTMVTTLSMKNSRIRKSKSKSKAVEFPVLKEGAQDLPVPVPPDDLASLQNQEDTPQPVDGTLVSVVEAEEHPEAVGAAAMDGGGCGVKNKIRRKTRGKGGR